MKFKIGDTVKITTGKDHGKVSLVTRIIPKTGRLIVKDAGQYKRHVKPREGVAGGIITLERPLSPGNLALICPACKQPTRVGYATPAKGDKHRICKKCQANLDVKTAPKKSKKK